MKFQGSVALVRWWKGPPVMALVPSTPVCIRRGKGRIRVFCKVLQGAIRGIPLTEERKRFLLKKGMNPDLIIKGYVFDVSNALASHFDKEREVFKTVAAKCGLTDKDLNRLIEAKKKLAAFQPSNHLERLAKRGLEAALSYKPQKKEVGKPNRIIAKERQQLRERAQKMKAAGQKRNEIVHEFAEEYGLQLSYVRRILEDRIVKKESQS